jgi:hypothetical protein
MISHNLNSEQLRVLRDQIVTVTTAPAKESVGLNIVDNVPKVVSKPLTLKTNSSKNFTKMCYGFDAGIRQELGIHSHDDMLETALQKFSKVVLRKSGKGTINAQKLLNAVNELLEKIDTVKSRQKVDFLSDSDDSLDMLLAKNQHYKTLESGVEKLIDSCPNEPNEGKDWQLSARELTQEDFEAENFSGLYLNCPLILIATTLKPESVGKLMRSTLGYQKEKDKRYEENFREGQDNLANLISHVAETLDHALLTTSILKEDTDKYTIPANIIADPKYAPADNTIRELYGLCDKIQDGRAVRVDELRNLLAIAKVLLAEKTVIQGKDNQDNIEKCIKACENELFYMEILPYDLQTNQILKPDHLNEADIDKPTNYLTSGVCKKGIAAGLTSVSEIGASILEKLFNDETVVLMKRYDLNVNESFSLFVYSTSAYNEINQQARRLPRKKTIIMSDGTRKTSTTKSMSPEVRVLRKYFMSAMEKLPRSGTSILYRSMMLDVLPDHIKIPYLTEGAIITELSPTSCSIAQGLPGKYDTRITIHKRGKKGDESTARVISQFSEVPGEGEELFPFNQRFRVISVKVLSADESEKLDGAKREITMVELGEDKITQIVNKRKSVTRGTSKIIKKVQLVKDEISDKAKSIPKKKVKERIPLTPLAEEIDVAPSPENIEHAFEVFAKMGIAVPSKAKRAADAMRGEQLSMQNQALEALQEMGLAKVDNERIGQWLIDLNVRKDTEIENVCDLLKKAAMSSAQLYDLDTFNTIANGIMQSGKSDKKAFVLALASPGFNQNPGEIATYLGDFKYTIQQNSDNIFDEIKENEKILAQKEEKLQSQKEDFDEIKRDLDGLTDNLKLVAPGEEHEKLKLIFSECDKKMKEMKGEMTILEDETTQIKLNLPMMKITYDQHQAALNYIEFLEDNV